MLKLKQCQFYDFSYYNINSIQEIFIYYNFCRKVFIYSQIHPTITFYLLGHFLQAYSLC